MKNLWVLAGKVVFWCSWPALWIYLRFSHRTRVIICSEGKVLVVKNWLGDGKWALPGGGLHKGEASREGAVREVLEETGITLNPEQLQAHGIYRHHDKGFRFAYELFSATLPSILVTRNQRVEIQQTAWLEPAVLTTDTANKELVLSVRVWLGSNALLQ